MANLITMVVNGTRYLLNEDAASVDQSAKLILDTYPRDAEVYFESPTEADINPHKAIRALWNE